MRHRSSAALPVRLEVDVLLLELLARFLEQLLADSVGPLFGDLNGVAEDLRSDIDKLGTGGGLVESGDGLELVLAEGVRPDASGVVVEVRAPVGDSERDRVH